MVVGTGEAGTSQTLMGGGGGDENARTGSSSNTVVNAVRTGDDRARSRAVRFSWIMKDLNNGDSGFPAHVPVSRSHRW